MGQASVLNESEIRRVFRILRPLVTLSVIVFALCCHFIVVCVLGKLRR